VRYVTTVDTFTALADPTRRRIIERLAGGERCAGELGEDVAMTQPAISKHLRVLREAGLVVARAEAQHRIYRLRPETLREVDDWLARYRKFWDERLDALQAFVEGGGTDDQ